MADKIALITGASSGLGVEVARLAAQEGYDVILVARRAEQLTALGEQLKQAHGVAAHPIALDLSDPAAPQRLFDEVTKRGLAVDVLVNNAGFGSNGAFLALPLEREAEMVQVNVQAVLKLCWLFGRGMRERKRGHILNIASTAGFQAGPYMATYYATKSFVLLFSEALHHELRQSGVTVTAHCPGATETGFAKTSGNDKSRLFRQRKPASSAEVAAHGWRAMKADR